MMVYVFIVEDIMKFLRLVAWTKTYFNGMFAYIGIINFLLLLLTFKGVYDIKIRAIILIPVSIIAALIIGFLDYEYVQTHQYEINNQVNDMKTQLDRIEKLVKEGKE